MEGGDYTPVDRCRHRKLRELAPSVQTWEPNPDGYSLILNGVVRVATGWNARAQLYSDETNGRLGVLLPPEGSVFQINTINVTGGRQEPRRRGRVHQLCALAARRKRRSPSGCSMPRPTPRPTSRQRRWRAPPPRRRTAPHDPGRLGRDREGARPVEQPLAPRGHRGTLTVRARGAWGHRERLRRPRNRWRGAIDDVWAVGDDLSLDVEQRRVGRAARSVGLRQDDDAAHARGPGRARPAARSSVGGARHHAHAARIGATWATCSSPTPCSRI